MVALDISRTKDIVTGILIVAGALGSVYNGFAPEDEARWAYSILAPDIDMAIEQADDNAASMSAQERRIVRLEEQAAILQRLVIGQLAAQGLLDKKITLGEPISLDEIRDEAQDELEDKKSDEIEAPRQHREPRTKRRSRPKAPWKQQAE